MNPLLQEALGSIVRAGFGWAAGFLVTRGLWTQQAAGTYVAAATLFALGLGWSFYQKYQSRLKLLTALTLPKGSTEQQVDHVVAKGEAPSVTTPKDETPAPTPPAP